MSKELREVIKATLARRLADYDGIDEASKHQWQEYVTEAGQLLDIVEQHQKLDSPKVLWQDLAKAIRCGECLELLLDTEDEGLSFFWPLPQLAEEKVQHGQRVKVLVVEAEPESKEGE